MDGDLKHLHAILQGQAKRHLAERERLRQELRNVGVPVPAAILQSLSKLSTIHARDVLRDHPGFSIWERRQSYEASLSIFRCSIEDLLSAIRQCEEAAHDRTFFNQAQNEKLNHFERRIEKELFAATNAAHAQSATACACLYAGSFHL